MSETSQDDRLIAWFDIDDTLYSTNTGVADAMIKLAHAYFATLGLDDTSAARLHKQYRNTYGLAVRGLVLHHKVDPFDYYAKTQGALLLEDMIKPDPNLRKLFEDIDRTKCQVWGLTNAFLPHGQRVLQLLGIEDQIDGLVACDVESPEVVCKPRPEYYYQALKQAKVTDASKCLFIDDRQDNVEAAKRLGWGRCVHFEERGPGSAEGDKVKFAANGDKDAVENDILVISDLEELRVVWSDIFRK